MAFDIQGLIVRVSEEGVKVTAEDLDKLTEASRDAEGAIEDLGDQSKETAKTVREFDVSVSKVGGMLGAFGSLLKAVPWAAVVTTMVGAASAIIDVGAEFEVLEKRLESIVGSAGGAQQALKWIEKFAIDTPASVDELGDAFIRLYNVGIEPTEGALQAVVDAGYAVGGSFQGVTLIVEQLAKSFGAGKMKGFELVQMIQAGIPAADILSEKLGTTAEAISDMANEAGLGRREMLLLIEGIRERYAGAAAEQMNTITGKIEQMKKAWKAFVHELSEAGALDAVKVSLDAMIGMLTNLLESGEGEKWAKRFGKAMYAVAIIVQTVAEIVPSAIGITVKSVQLILADFLSGIAETIDDIYISYLAFTLMNPGAEMIGNLAGWGDNLKYLAEMSAEAAESGSKLNTDIDKLQNTMADGVSSVLATVNAMDALGEGVKKAGDAAGGGGDGGGGGGAAQKFKYYFQGFTLGMQEVKTGLIAFGESLDQPQEQANTLGSTFEDLTGDATMLTAAMEALTPAIMSFVTGVSPAVVTAAELAEKMKILRGQFEGKGFNVANLVHGLEKIGVSTKTAVEAIKKLGLETQKTEITFGQLEIISEAFGISMDDLVKVLGWAADNAEELDGRIEGLAKTFLASEQLFANFVTKTAGLFTDTFTSFFEGEMDSISELFSSFFGDIAETSVSAFVSAFSEALFSKEGLGGLLGKDGSLVDLFKGESGAVMGIGGLGMTYQAATAPGMSSGERFMGGAMGGAATGAYIGTLVNPGIGTAVGAVIGAIVGGVAAVLAGGKEDPAITNLRLSEGGVSMVTRGQQASARDERVVEMQVHRLYRDMNAQWRDALRMFADSDLFGFLRDMPRLDLELEDMTMSEVEAWLRESKLPQMFQSRYGRAIRTGLQSLGMSLEGINAVFDELKAMPGSERAEALGTVIQAFKGIQDLLEMDFGALQDRVGQTVFDDYLQQMDLAADAMDNMTLGWEEMSLTERAEDLLAIGGIFEAVTRDTMVMLAALEQISKQLTAMFEQTIEGFTTRGMEDEDLWGHLEDRFNYYNNLLQNTDDPELILEYTNALLGILRQAGGMLTDEQWLEQAGNTGQTWQEWFLHMTAQLQTEAEEAVQALEDQIRERYEALYGQVERITSDFDSLGLAVEDTLIPFGELPPHLWDLLDVLDRFVLRFSDDTPGGGLKSETLASPQVQVNVSAPTVIVKISGSIAALKPMIKTEVVNYTNSLRNNLRKRVTKRGAFN